MLLQVRLFGGLAAHAGAARVEIDLPDGATAGELPDAIAVQLPGLAGMLRGVKVAVDLEVAEPDRPLAGADEVALLPPVAGGAGEEPESRESTPSEGSSPILPAVTHIDDVATLTGLLDPPLPLQDAIAAITRPDVGATATFLGTVRDHAPDLTGVVALDYSAYPEMADKVLATIAAEIVEDHPELRGLALLHTVGELEVGAHTILIACAAAHREPAFDACRDALERVKSQLPVWKQERTEDGASRWVGLEGPPST